MLDPDGTSRLAPEARGTSAAGGRQRRTKLRSSSAGEELRIRRAGRP